LRRRVSPELLENRGHGELTSSKLADAMDLSKDDPQIVERYGTGSPTFQADGAPKMTENFLIARRLVEAGARVVTLNFSRWDWHGQNFKRGREDFPLLDRALSALVTDLHQRGLDKDVSVVVWGEFGRTPKINKNAGRDHWPKVSCAMLAGGGMRTGQSHRRNQPVGRIRQGAARHIPRGLRHALHEHGLESERDTRVRPPRPSPLPGRLGRGTDS
jgi:hypothetical protein